MTADMSTSAASRRLDAEGGETRARARPLDKKLEHKSITVTALIKATPIPK
jgi:hypothetical protein